MPMTDVGAKEADDRRREHGDMLRTLIHMDEPDHKEYRPSRGDCERLVSKTVHYRSCTATPVVSNEVMNALDPTLPAMWAPTSTSRYTRTVKFPATGSRRSGLIVS